MPTVSPQQATPGEEITAASVNTPNNQIAAVINGGLDDTNISGLSGSKIAAGTLPASASTPDANIDTRFGEAFSDFVASGCVWSATTGLEGAMTAGVVYVSGKRLQVNAITSHAFTASRDTYVYVNSSGLVDYAEVANGASSPSLPADSIWLAEVITNASSVTSVIQSGSDSGQMPIYYRGAVNGPEAPGIWWQEIGRTTLRNAGDTITVANLPPRDHLLLLVKLTDTGGTIQGRITFNNDNANNYAIRYSINGAADSTSLNQPFGLISQLAAQSSYAQVHVLNAATESKLVYGHTSEESSTAGAGNAPNKFEFTFKWVNTSDQITRVDVINPGTGDFAVGSEVVVLAHN